MYAFESYPSRIRSDARVCLLSMVRNESAILDDFIAHGGTFADEIVFLDDGSDDDSVERIRRGDKVTGLARDLAWSPLRRPWLETEHREILRVYASHLSSAEWFVYLDPDERVEGDLSSFLRGGEAREVDALRIRLFDAYLTADDRAPYRPGETLLGRRRWFGPEARDILMAWRRAEGVRFIGTIAREPVLPPGARVETRFLCQHYGKALSVEGWEAKCDFYSAHFPWDTYGRKWQARKGKAIHDGSDFGRPLYPWGEELFREAVRIHP